MSQLWRRSIISAIVVPHLTWSIAAFDIPYSQQRLPHRYSRMLFKIAARLLPSPLRCVMPNLGNDQAKIPPQLYNAKSQRWPCSSHCKWPCHLVAVAMPDFLIDFLSFSSGCNWYNDGVACRVCLILDHTRHNAKRLSLVKRSRTTLQSMVPTYRRSGLWSSHDYYHLSQSRYTPTVIEDLAWYMRDRTCLIGRSSLLFDVLQCKLLYLQRTWSATLFQRSEHTTNSTISSKLSQSSMRYVCGRGSLSTLLSNGWVQW